jgi:hypothetical protein
LAAAPLPSSESSWGVQALVRRVVELTTELHSVTSANDSNERRLHQLERDARQRLKSLNEAKTATNEERDRCMKAEVALEVLRQQLIDAEKRRIEEQASHQREHDELVLALREAEAEVAALEASREELSQQIGVGETNAEFRNWLEGLLVIKSEGGDIPVDGRVGLGQVADHADQKAKAGEPSPAESRGNVRDLVTSLLLQWRETLNAPSQQPHEKGAGFPRGALSQAEQQFLQKVCNLVTNANEKCEASQLEAEVRFDIALRTRC